MIPNVCKREKQRSLDNRKRKRATFGERGLKSRAEALPKSPLLAFLECIRFNRAWDVRKRHFEAMRIPFSSSARTVCESELAFQADCSRRMDSGWQDWIGCARELQAVNVEPLQFHFNLPLRCSPIYHWQCLDLLVGQEKHVEPA
jgi:hypothetical protein